jgi:hypothetical protein
MYNVMMLGVRNKTILNDFLLFNYDSKQDRLLLQRQMDAINSSIVFFYTSYLQSSAIIEVNFPFANDQKGFE